MEKERKGEREEDAMPNQKYEIYDNKPGEPTGCQTVVNKRDNGDDLLGDMAALRAIDPQVLADWQELRRSKRAPINETAVAGIAREAKRAGLSLEDALRLSCEFGWGGFRAEWLLNKLNQTNRRNSNDQRADIISALTGYRPPPNRDPDCPERGGRVIDITPVRRRANP